MNTQFDVIVVGAGASGMMCALEAGKRGRRVLMLEHNRKPGEKIRISGGGRCNFTNSGTDAKHFLSQNVKFGLSALRRYRPAKFIELVDQYNIAWHEKSLGQLFCNESAQQVIDMLRSELDKVGVPMRLGVVVSDIERDGEGFSLRVDGNALTCASLVVATGGKSIPKMGATTFGYKVAEQFGLGIIETRPGLVPLTFDPDFLAWSKELSGISMDVRVRCGKKSFDEAMLFTHRGLSGPAILQISSFWQPGDTVEINLLPHMDVLAALKEVRAAPGKREAVGVIAEWLPKRLAQSIAEEFPGRVGEMNDKRLGQLADRMQRWQVKPTGSEGYRTAEVTLGGVDTADLDARTLMAKNVPGLYFVGEVVDVTGWLGGYNFQWAWASGWAAGQAV